MKGRISAMGVITGVFFTLAVMAIVGLVVVYTGGYNVAATDPHTPLGRWATSTTMENSVKGRAAGIAEPKFTPAMIAQGGAEYKAMCAQCHGGPGAEPAEWATGMLPKPPSLVEHVGEWRPREVFWMLKHGIKMSAMPAFGPTHDDKTLWAIAAFAKQLPGMTAEQYAAVQAEEEHGQGGHHGDKAGTAEGGTAEGGSAHRSPGIRIEGQRTSR